MCCGRICSTQASLGVRSRITFRPVLSVSARSLEERLPQRVQRRAVLLSTSAAMVHTSKATAEAQLPETTKVPPKPVGKRDILSAGGVTLPLVGLGCHELNSPDHISSALELGYRHFDCAKAYGNQELCGQAFMAAFDKGLVKRKDLTIASKLWNDNHYPKDVRPNALDTIKLLQADYLDLYYIHWPEAFKPGTSEVVHDVSIKETWQALEELVDSGHVKVLGVSNFSLRQIKDLLTYARHKPVVNQVELHPLNAQQRLVDRQAALGVQSVAYGPLAGKVLEEKDRDVIEGIAKETGRPFNQVILKWNVQRGVAVIPRSRQVEHQRANFEGLFDWELSEDQVSRLNSLDRGKRGFDLPFHDFTGTDSY